LKHELSPERIGDDNGILALSLVNLNDNFCMEH